MNRAGGLIGFIEIRVGETLIAPLVKRQLRAGMLKDGGIARSGAATAPLTGFTRCDGATCWRGFQVLREASANCMRAMFEAVRETPHRRMSRLIVE